MSKRVTEAEIVQRFLTAETIFDKKSASNFMLLEEPSIYLFKVKSLDAANKFYAVKVGDTARDVSVRLAEWNQIYKNLIPIGHFPAYITDDNTGDRYYFRDYVVHDWLMNHGYIPLRKASGKSYEKLLARALNVPEDDIVGGYVSNEFYVNRDFPNDESKAVTMSVIQRAIDSFKADPKLYNLRSYFSARGASTKIDYRSQPAVDYAPFPYQRRAVRELVNKLATLEKIEHSAAKVLLDSGTGSGKSNMFCWSVKGYLGFNEYNDETFDKVFSPAGVECDNLFVVLTSALPDVFEEIRKAVETHAHFRDSIAYMSVPEYVSSNGAKLSELHDAGYKIVIMGVSLQNLAGRKDSDTDDTDDGIVTKQLKKIHDLLVDDGVDLVIGDEAHMAMFGEGEEYKAALKADNVDIADVTGSGFSRTDKEKFQLNPKRGYIFATATTEKILVQEVFPYEKSVVFVSQKEIDDQARVENDRAETAGTPEKSAFYGKPEVHFFGLDLDPTMAFELNDDNAFVRPEMAREVLSALFGRGKFAGMPPLMSDPVIQAAGCGRHILMQFQRKAVCDAAEDLLTEILGTEFVIANVASLRNPKNLGKVNDFKRFMVKNQFKKTITLTVNKYATGTSINQWDTVVVARAGNSTTLRQQAYGRAFRTWVEEITYDDNSSEKVVMKPNSLIVDFCGGSLYEILNQEEIDSRALGDKGTDSGAGTGNNGDNGKSGDDDKPYTGNVYGYDPFTMQFRALTRKDIHEQLESYLQREPISRMVDRLLIPSNLKSLMTKEMMSDFVVSRNGKSVNVGLTEVDDNGPSTTREGSGNDGVPYDGTHDDGENSGEAATGSNDDDIENVKELYAKGVLERTLLLAAVAKTDDTGKRFENFAQLFDFMKFTQRGQRMARNFDLAAPGVHEYLELVNKNAAATAMFESSLKSVVLQAMESVDDYLRVVNDLSRLSPNEVFTPVNVADLLVQKAGLAPTNDTLMETVVQNWRNVLNSNNWGIIDNGDKSGIIPVQAFRAGTNAIGESESLENLFYSVPTSDMAYEIIRETYEMMGWPVENVLWDQEIVNKDTKAEKNWALSVARGEVDLGTMVKKSMLERNEDVETMGEKFDYCISNPPYQLDVSKKENKTNTFVDIYPDFQKAAQELSNIVTMIYPARWQRDIQSGFGQYLVQNGLKSSMNYLAQNIFGNSVKRGIILSVVLSEKGYTGNILSNNVQMDRAVPVWIGDEASEILYETTLQWTGKYLNGVSFITEFSNIRDSGLDFHSTSKDLADPVRIYIKKNPGKQADAAYFYIEQDKILPYVSTKNANYEFGKFNVLVQSAVFGRQSIFDDMIRSRGSIQARVFDKDEIAGKTLASVRSFDNREDAENFVKYMNSKMVSKWLYFDYSKKSFGSQIPDLGDYSNKNDLFKDDKNLSDSHKYKGLSFDDRLLKFFNLSEEKIAIIKSEW